MPLHVVATDLATGEGVVISTGDVVASAAIPGVFPPVTIDGRVLVDGGVSSDVPIAHAVERGATTVYVLPTGYACGLQTAPASALGVAMQSLTLLLQQKLYADIARFAREVDLRVLPPICPLAVAPIDFSHSVELIDHLHELSAASLERGDWSSAAGLLSLHGHV